ncbi:unnamed protein product [Camellia sinensis]
MQVKKMSTDVSFILDALQISSTIKVQDGKIRRRDKWPKWVPTSIEHKLSSPALRPQGQAVEKATVASKNEFDKKSDKKLSNNENMEENLSANREVIGKHRISLEWIQNFFGMNSEFWIPTSTEQKLSSPALRPQEQAVEKATVASKNEFNKKSDEKLSNNENMKENLSTNREVIEKCRISPGWIQNLSGDGSKISLETKFLWDKFRISLGTKFL